jgi:hypothetical protein
MDIKIESPPIEEPEAIIPMEAVSSGKAEAIIPMEAVSSGKAEAIIPPEIVSSESATTSTTVRLRRRAANRTEPLYLRRSTRQRQPPGYFASPPPPQDEEIPARKKPRLEEPLPTTADQAARKTDSPDVSEGHFPPGAGGEIDNDDANENAEPETDSQTNAGVTMVTHRHWTSEEDAKLTSAVTNTSKKKYGKGYKTDWGAVAVIVPSRTQMQCMRRWKETLDPSIDRVSRHKGKWAEDEDSKLRDAVKTYGAKDWVAVAALVPGRTEQQCRDKWKHGVDSSIDETAGRTGKWAEDEDSKLKDAVNMHGGKNWGAVAALIPGRTKIQCRQRWHDALDLSIGASRRKKFTVDEDIKLKAAVQTHGGKNWDAIAALVPGRTKIQCWHRWRYALDPSINRLDGRAGKWAEEEDSKLMGAVQTHGSKDWAGIAALVPGRVDSQCRSRWHGFLKHSIDQAAGSKGEWAAVEDSKLKDAVQTHGGKNWVAIAALVPGRAKMQCYGRWKDVLNPIIGRASGRTGKWAEDEDSKLKNIVQTHGDKDWAAISALIQGRTKKQCNYRWNSVLKPNIDGSSGRMGT